VLILGSVKNYPAGVEIDDRRIATSFDVYVDIAIAIITLLTLLTIAIAMSMSML
jgi:hypothetical protein